MLFFVFLFAECPCSPAEELVERVGDEHLPVLQDGRPREERLLVRLHLQEPQKRARCSLASQTLLICARTDRKVWSLMHTLLVLLECFNVYGKIFHQFY